MDVIPNLRAYGVIFVFFAVTFSAARVLAYLISKFPTDKVWQQVEKMGKHE